MVVLDKKLMFSTPILVSPTLGFLTVLSDGVQLKYIKEERI